MKTRRHFIQISSAGLVAGCSQAQNESGYIDAHVHVWTPDTESYPIATGFKKEQMRPASFTPEELFSYCKPHGVTRIVLIQMSFYGFDNSYMLDMMEKHPGVFGGVAIVDETDPNLKVAMLDLSNLGVRGFRIRTTKEQAESWPSSPGMLEMWKTGAENNLAMCLLADPDSLPAVLEMCRKFPETPVVIDHFARLGMTGTVDQAQLDTLLKLAEFKKVKVKTSAFYALGKKAAPYEDLGPMVRQLRDAFGARRLMWATDCPYQVQGGHNYADSIALIRDRLDFLTDEDKSWMLRKTAEETFFPLS